MKTYSSFSKSLLLACVLLFLFAFKQKAAAQTSESAWQVHTSLREVVDMALSSDAAWVATKGGIYKYLFSSGEIKRYTTLEGLQSILPKAIAYDTKRKSIWVGYEDGVLDRLDVEKGSVESYRDIARAAQFTSKAIGRIVVQGDSVFVTTEFGLVVFDPIKNEVRDSYTQFGTSVNNKVYDVFVDTIPNGQKGFWVAIDDGVAYAPLKSPNLREPSAWTVDSSIPAGRSIGKLGGSIIVGTTLDGYSLSGGKWVRQGFFNGEVKRIQTTKTQVCITTPFWFVKLNNVGARVQVSSTNYVSMKSALIADDGSVWVGDGITGLAQFTGVPDNGVQTINPVKKIVPNGPEHNLFSALMMDTKGNLWGTAAGDLKGGMYQYDPSGIWTTVNNVNTPELANKFGFERIHADTKGNLWAGASRAGVGLIQRTSDNKFVIFDDKNSTLKNVPGYPGDIRIGGIASEKDGTLWVTNLLTVPRLHVRTTDGKWTSFNDFTDASTGSVFGDFSKIFVDSFGQKWVMLTNEGGLMVLNTKGTPANQADDKVRWWNTVGTKDTGLPSGQVRAVAEDRKGGVWVGTNRGLTIFVFGSLASDATTQPNWPRFEGKLVLRDLYINDMAIDPANRMWIASNEGVWLINAETYEQLEHFTTQNSPLFSDNVSAVTVDSQTGRVYFATDDGLLSYQGNAVVAKTEVQTLSVYPNPAIGTATSMPQIYIDGLIDNTTIRVLNVSGLMLAQFDARGGRTVWDGKDTNGNLVPSGVYVIVALGKDGEERAFGKIAIVR